MHVQIEFRNLIVSKSAKSIFFPSNAFPTSLKWRCTHSQIPIQREQIRQLVTYTYTWLCVYECGMCVCRMEIVHAHNVFKMSYPCVCVCFFTKANGWHALLVCIGACVFACECTCIGKAFLSKDKIYAHYFQRSVAPADRRSACSVLSKCIIVISSFRIII